MPGFDMTTTQGSATCNTPPTIKIHSLLKEAGLPDKPTRVQLYLYDNRGSGYQWYLVKEATDPNIIEDYTFDNPAYKQNVLRELLRMTVRQSESKPPHRLSQPGQTYCCLPRNSVRKAMPFSRYLTLVLTPALQ